MPELPEVETMASDLRGAICGRKIERVKFFVPAMIKYPAPEKFASGLEGAKILDVSRRAKYLRFELDGERVMLTHPKMTGHFLLVTKTRKHKSTEAQKQENKYTRINFQLDDGSVLGFSDIRKFGTLRLFSKKEAEEFLGELGPEPLSLEAGKFVSLISSEKRKIKQVLMDPAVIVGIGNIYSDEALYLAGIHPERRANDLSSAELKSLHRVILKVLKKAIRLRGSSINNYRDTRGEKGEYQNARLVYGRRGEACGKCSTVIGRIVVAGRSACFCSECQK